MALFRWIEQFRTDWRYGIRSLRRTPNFTLMAVGSLALGIGAATAMYSVIHAVIVDPFPYKDVDSLMSIRVQDASQPGSRTYYTVDQYLEFARRSTIFEGVIASTISDVVWTGAGEPRRLRGNHVTMNTFEVMGVEPLAGRVVTAAHAERVGDTLAILGYRFWQRQFGGDVSVIGRPLQLNGKVRTVIGIMPQRFMWRGADVYLPVIYRHGEVTEGVRDVHVLGRLKRGVTAAQAEADLRPIVDELRRQNPRQFPQNYRVSLLSFKETFPSGLRHELWVLFGAVGLLLLIACVNVSNLLLSKAGVRGREIAVRASLGATRSRVIRQLLSESLVLGVAGSLLGIALAYAGLAGIISMLPPGTIPDESKIEISTPVLWFTMAVCFLAAVLFGLAPAVQASGQDPIIPLRQAGRGTAGTVRQSVLRNGLVVGEVALSIMLLVGATLMIRTLISLTTLDLSMAPERILTLRIPLSEQRYPSPERRNQFRGELLERVRNLPGVAAVGVNTFLHPVGGWNMRVEVPGAEQQDPRPVLFHQVSEDYTKVMGAALLRGRLFSERDVVNRAAVALVNQAFVDRFLPGKDPLGRTVRVPGLRTPPVRAPLDSFEVVGVVRNVLNRIYTNELVAELYIPHTVGAMANYLAVLARSSVEPLITEVPAQVYAVDRDQPVMDVKTLENVLGDWVYARPRFNLLLFSVFAGLGLTLALLGIYGVISHGVSQQTQEIGIRLALGASRRDVMSMVLRRGVLLIGLGVVIGVAASMASVRVLARQVYTLSTTDPLTFIAVSALVLLAGVAACLRPARRATRIEPVTALRYE